MFQRFLEALMAALGVAYAVLWVAACCSAGEPEAPLAPERLRCEYLSNPLGIGVRGPRLSWILRDPRRGAVQAAYQIRVAGSSERLAAGRADVWDTGKVVSDRTIHVVYRGRPLESGKSYCWQVRTWDARGRPSPWSRPARWSMGLLAPGDWKARWIGDPAPPPPDSPAHNGYQSGAAASPDAERWVMIDLGQVRRVDAVRLYGARPFDRTVPDAPGYLFPVRLRIDVSRRPDPKTFRTVVDRTAEDVVNPGAQPLTYRFPAADARYVRLVVTRLQQRDQSTYAFAVAEMEVLGHGRNLARGAKVTAVDSHQDATWSTAKLVDGDVFWHPAGPAVAMPQPILRKGFTIDGDVRRATAYVTALGLYELRMNGQRVGDHVLAPEWTDYSKRVLYQTYDVSRLLRRGENVVGALLGDGWYAGRVGMAQVFRGRLRAVYGRKPRLLVQLEMELSDGRRQTVASDGTWRSTLEGPIRSSDIYDGETYDARREMPGWDRPGFRDLRWRPVEVDDSVRPALVAQRNEPIRITHRLKPKQLTEPQPGAYVVDFGQNFAGWVRIHVQGKRGTRITLRHAERLNLDGTLYLAGLRGAPQTDRFILRGDPQGGVFQPHFTYHGFRYVEVTGLEGRPSLESIVGLAFHSDAPECSSFECSDPVLNRLWQNLVWTERSNLMGIPTDCCQRDERLPWAMPDVTQTDFFLKDLGGLVTRYAEEMRLAQGRDGGFPHMAPNVLHMPTGTPGWGEAAGVWMPWTFYVNYGDRRLLAAHYPGVRKWVEQLHGSLPDRICRRETFGDWLNGDTLLLPDWPPGGAAVPNDVIATAFSAHSARIAAEMAKALGRREDAQRYRRLFEEFRAAFNRAFVDRQGRIAGDTQAGYAIALRFDLLPEELRAAAIEHLLAAIRRYHGRLSTGNHGTHRLLIELSRAGHHDLAYRLVTGRRCPSYRYMVDQGATTIWERWDSYVPDRSPTGPRLRWQAVDPANTYVAAGPFQDPGMDALNHRGFITVGQWMMQMILGIEPDEGRPGYKRFTIHPRPPGDLTSAKGWYDSIRGRIGVHWRREPEVFQLYATIPPNSSATVYVPAAQSADVFERGWPASTAPGIEFSRMHDGCAVFRVEAGSYRFRSRRTGTAQPPSKARQERSR